MGNVTLDGMDQASNYLRKTAAYNALRNTYGDIAGDPEAATNLQNLAQSAELQPGRVQAQKDTSTQSQAQTRLIDANTGKVPGEIALNAAQTTNLGASTAHTVAETGEVAPNAASTRAAQDAQAAEARARAAGEPSAIAARQAQAAQANAEAAKLTQATREAQDLSQSQDGLALAQTLIKIRDKAATGPGAGVLKSGDPGGQAVASYLSKIPPAQLQAMGIDPTHVAPLMQTLQADPSKLETVAAALAAKVAAAGGVVDDNTATLLGGILNKTGQVPALGQGKVGTANRVKVFQNAAQQAAAAGKDANAIVNDRQDTKARQIYVDDLSKQGIQNAGGQTKLASAIAGHTNLLEKYVAASNNPDLRIAATIRKDWLEQTGSSLPTTVEGQAHFLAGELTRLYTSRGDNTMTKAFADQANNTHSKKQLNDFIASVRTNITTQLGGMRQGALAVGAESEFDKHLTDDAKALLPGASAAPAAGGGGWSNFRAH